PGTIRPEVPARRPAEGARRLSRRVPSADERPAREGCRDLPDAGRPDDRTAQADPGNRIADGIARPSLTSADTRPWRTIRYQQHRRTGRILRRAAALWDPRRAVDSARRSPSRGSVLIASSLNAAPRVGNLAPSLTTDH